MYFMFAKSSVLSILCVHIKQIFSHKKSEKFFSLFKYFDQLFIQQLLILPNFEADRRCILS